MSENQQKAQDQGLSLLDIGALAVNVPIGDKSIKVFGVSAKGALALFQRFPEVGLWFKGGVRKVDPQTLLAEVPGALAAIIAAGCGLPGDEKAEENAGLLPVEAQLDVIEAILKLTFTKGFGPFVQRIVALSAQAESLNYGKALGMTSPPVSKPASPPDTATTQSGT